MDLALAPDPAQREALRQACADLDAAELSRQDHRLLQALTALAAVYRGLGALISAETCLDRALRHAHGQADATADLLARLAEVAADQSSQHEAQRRGRGHAARERARDRAFAVVRLAQHVADPSWEVRLLLQVSEVLTRCGDHDDAAQLQSRALRLMCGQAGDAANPALLPAPGRLADA